MSSVPESTTRFAFTAPGRAGSGKVQTAERSFILGVDSFAGRDDAVIKSLEDFRPKGVAGVTTLSNGQIVLILDMKELLIDLNAHIDRDVGIRQSKSLELYV